jgi:hypothetical protein
VVAQRPDGQTASAYVLQEGRESAEHRGEPETACRVQRRQAQHAVRRPVPAWHGAGRPHDESQRERAGDLAILRATGWTARDLARLPLYEGIGLTLLGGLTGSVLGVAIVTALSFDLLGGHLLMFAAAGLLGTLLLITASPGDARTAC